MQQPVLSILMLTYYVISFRKGSSLKAGFCVPMLSHYPEESTENQQNLTRNEAQMAGFCKGL